LIKVTQQLTLRRALGWVASDLALSWTVIIVLALYPFLIGLLQSAPADLALAINIHLFDLVGGIGNAGVLLVFRLAYDSKPQDKPGLLKVLIAWVLAASFGATFQLGVAASVGAVPNAYIEGIPFGVLSFVGLMFAATMLRSVTGELRKSRRELAMRQSQLDVLRNNLQAEVLSQREELAQEVQSRIGETVQRLQAEAKQLSALSVDSRQAKELSAHLMVAIDGLIRPLSNEIAEGDRPVELSELNSVKQIEKRIRRLPFMQRMRSKVWLGAVFNVTFTAGGYLVFVIPSFAFIFGLKGFAAVGLPATLVSLAVLLLLNRVTTRIQAPYALALIAVFAAGLLATLPYLLIGDALLGPANAELVAYLGLEAFLVSAVTTYGALFFETAFLNLARATDANAETRQLVAHLQHETQINRRNMAQVMHGRLQARLQAASIKLAQADLITDELVREVEADLVGTWFEGFESGADRLSAAEQLAEIAKNWDGICELTFTFEAGVAELVDASARAKTAVVEVIREAVNNAVKHGDADEADAVISLAQPGLVKVVVRNAVHSAPGASVSGTAGEGGGYGSKMLGQIAQSWAVKFEDGDAILEANIRLDQ
jgi:hypothetical protein